MWAAVAAVGGAVSLLRIGTTWLSAERAPKRRATSPQALACAVGIAEGEAFRPWIPAKHPLPGTWKRFVQCAPTEDGLLLVPLDLDGPRREQFTVVVGPVTAGSVFVLELELDVLGTGELRARATDKRRGVKLPARIDGPGGKAYKLPTAARTG